VDDLLHKLVSGAIAGGLIALAGWLGVERRKRQAAKAAAQSAAAEDPSQVSR